MELAGVHHRYHAPMSRSVHLGKPSREYRRLAEATDEALARALEIARPGMHTTYA